MSKTELEEKLKLLIIEVLNLEDLSPEDIDSQLTLFGDGLGLDSIDALELGLAIKERFSVSLEGDENIKSHFQSVSTLASHIIAQQS